MGDQNTLIKLHRELAEVCEEITAVRTDITLAQGRVHHTQKGYDLASTAETRSACARAVGDLKTLEERYNQLAQRRQDIADLLVRAT